MAAAREALLSGLGSPPSLAATVMLRDSLEKRAERLASCAALRCLVVVAFQFERKGQIVVPKQVETGDKKNPIGPNGAAADEEEFMLAVAEAGP